MVSFWLTLLEGSCVPCQHACSAQLRVGVGCVLAVYTDTYLRGIIAPNTGRNLD